MSGENAKGRVQVAERQVIKETNIRTREGYFKQGKKFALANLATSWTRSSRALGRAS